MYAILWNLFPFTRPEFTVDYFIRKFETTKENQWCIGWANNSKGQHCAVGFCRDDTERMALVELFKEHGLSVVDVNDGDVQHDWFIWLPPTPRRRILMALSLMKNKANVNTPTDLKNFLGRIFRWRTKN
jgi:hypothetical protein